MLRDVSIRRPNQVWSTDVTYVPLARGFMYRAAIIDWYSRYVLAWRLSNTLDGSFCLEMLDEALLRGRPEVFNTDQGVQFTAAAWTGRLESAGVAVSMDGKVRPFPPTLAGVLSAPEATLSLPGVADDSMSASPPRDARAGSGARIGTHLRLSNGPGCYEWYQGGGVTTRRVPPVTTV